ncbi:toxin HicA [Methylomonas koyamae]|uniref:toxin HicA n=1 Tax=Methylomonas koyamae TaxID=702114 RepID=UPI000BC2C92B|nr:toxin HicA [Methylomonas koyamae]ATG90777.1 hypothetical protein MKLM6_2557 [Methylomonas koyamae]
MGKYDKLLYKILSGRSDGNIAFAELMQLLKRMDFEVRIRGDHHIFTRVDIAEILNLQPNGAMAKSYQVKQVRQVIVKYQLGLRDE